MNIQPTSTTVPVHTTVSVSLHPPVPVHTTVSVSLHPPVPVHTTVSVSLHPPQCPYTSIPVVRFMPVVMRDVHGLILSCTKA